MSNTLGKNITLTLFGESHGKTIGAVLDGIAPGVVIDMAFVEKIMEQRKPADKIGTDRHEVDKVKFISGVTFNNGNDTDRNDQRFVTTGDSIALIIENSDVVESDNDNSRFPRPSHSDFAQVIRSHGHADTRGGGHLSGRLTAPIVAAGAIVLSMLRSKGIEIETTIDSIAGIKNVSEDILKKAILSAKENGDSVGGILETKITGIPAGIGEPFFDSIESLISHAVFSVPGVKGIEFGLGFEMTSMLGSEANDAFTIEAGKVITKTNNNGGINGGISNGMPITFKTAIKPTPSIAQTEDTVDLKLMKAEKINITGRHDPCIAARAGIVISALTALSIADVLVSRFGTEYFAGENI